MTRAPLIVCEKAFRWAPAWRRLLEDQELDLRLHEVRSLRECSELLNQWPESWLAIEVDATNATEALKWIAAAESRFPQARVVGLLANADDELVWAVREAGGLEIARSLRELGEFRLRRLESCNPRTVTGLTRSQLNFPSPAGPTSDTAWFD